MAYKPVAPLEGFRNGLHLQTCYPDSDSDLVGLLVVSVRLDGNVPFVLVFGHAAGKGIEIGMIERFEFRLKVGFETEVENRIRHERKVGQEDRIGPVPEVVEGQKV